MLLLLAAMSSPPACAMQECGRRVRAQDAGAVSSGSVVPTMRAAGAVVREAEVARRDEVRHALARLEEAPEQALADEAIAFLTLDPERRELVTSELLLRFHRLILDPPGLQRRRRDAAVAARADRTRERLLRLALSLGGSAVAIVEPLLLLEHMRRHAGVRAEGDDVDHLSYVHRFGIPAIPVLTLLLDSGVPAIRGLAAEALGRFGAEAATAEDLLVRNALHYDSASEFESTILGLRQIGVRKPSNREEIAGWARHLDAGDPFRIALDRLLRDAPGR